MDAKHRPASVLWLGMRSWECLTRPVAVIDSVKSSDLGTVDYAPSVSEVSCEWFESEMAAFMSFEPCASHVAHAAMT